MAKKAAKTKAKTVSVNDLATEFGVEGRKVRMVIRGLGMKAPEVKGQEGFGPRSRYEWTEGDKDLDKIRKALKEAPKPKPKPEGEKPKKKGKKGKKAKSEDEDEDAEDEDTDEDSDDEESDEEDDEDDDE